MSGKIKKISEKVDYKCPYFEIVKKQFILPNKKRINYYLLKRNNFVTTFVEDGEYTYMVEFFRFAINDQTLEFPAGIINNNEKPLQAAQRELEEEAGIVAKKFTFLGWSYGLIGMSDLKNYVFLAKNISFTKQKLDDAEYGMKVRKIKISQVGNLIKKGKVRGEHAINAYCLYLLKKKKL